MSNPIDQMNAALLALQAMPRNSGWCLGYTRRALVLQGLRLPPPMPSPNDTAFANFSVLSQDPGAYGWSAVDISNSAPVKLIYFQNVAPLANPFRYAGHVGLLANGTIYSDSDYPLTAGWISHFAGAFVPVGELPKVIIAKMGGANPSIDGRTYTAIPCTWNADLSVVSIQTADLQAAIGTAVGGLPANMGLRDALTQLQVQNNIVTQHMTDPTNPAVYVFVA